MKILIADDNEDIRDILASFAEGAGFEVAAAADGREALDLALQGDVSLLLLDVMMPELDGFEVCKEIRRVSDLPIIMITAQNMGDEDKISLGNLTLLKANGTALVAGKALPLTRKEYDLLLLFLAHKGRVFSRDELLDRLWGYDYTGDTRTVDTHMRRLRAKLEKGGAQGLALATVWGRGYRLEETTC